MIKSSQEQGFRLRPNETTIAAVDTLKTSFLPNLSIDAHFCPMCGQSFPRQNILTEHMHACHPSEMLFAATSLNRIEYPCLSCDEKFSSGTELDEHNRVAHQAFRFTRCVSCGLYGITTIDGDYKCVHCGNTCGVSPATTMAAVGQPIYLEQPPMQSYPPMVEDEEEGDVDIMPKVPPLTIRLPKIKEEASEVKEEASSSVIQENPSPYHLPPPPPRMEENDVKPPVTVVGNVPPPLNSNSNTNTTTVNANNKIRHKCPECPRTFKTQGTLAMHRKIHSGEADYTPKERPYSCSYCGKCFTQSNTLKQHTRIHTGEKPFRCGYCGRAFTVKDYLNKHITTHTGEKPFRCVYCNKAFSVKDYLTKHIRTHTGEKPYACPYCDKRFTQRSALTVHTTKLHPI
ncbi:chorion transcription factor Cf2 isoform X1 [Episyrphus balteatus]|uniref:chorion transcription factor Cf2 isoform X1 n=1 Tax=Episyrphus balteatus TaxID=286459 RepID=UPI0024869261|nr:chorion transcription factor Cf2 isoform X1 [Episyrphus balteatus]